MKKGYIITTKTGKKVMDDGGDPYRSRRDAEMDIAYAIRGAKNAEEGRRYLRLSIRKV